MEDFIDFTAFKRSMMLGILFQGDLAIPDVFFFVTQYIPYIIMSDKPAASFVASALRNDAIIPIFRSGEHTSFRQSLDRIRFEGIQGIHPEADAACEFLENSVRGKRLHYRLWPDAPVSVGYKQILERCLLVDPADAISPTFEQFWTRTKDTRTAIFDRLRPDDRGGFRRGDVMNAVHFHITRSSERVDDVKTIWKNLKNKTEADDIKKLLKWFSYAYQFNQGRMFGLSPTLTAMDDVDAEFSRRLATLASADDAGIMWNDEFAIPSVDALLTIDPSLIFDVRNGATGLEYFESVEIWQKEPSETTSNVLLDRLAKYTDEINRLFIARGKSILNWEWHIKAYIPEDKIWNKTGLELAKDAIGEIIPHFGLFSLVGPLGAATYEWWPASVRKKLGLANRVKLEVEKGAKRTRLHESEEMDASFR